MCVCRVCQAESSCSRWDFVFVLISGGLDGGLVVIGFSSLGVEL